MEKKEMNKKKIKKTTIILTITIGLGIVATSYLVYKNWGKIKNTVNGGFTRHSINFKNN